MRSSSKNRLNREIARQRHDEAADDTKTWYLSGKPKKRKRRPIDYIPKKQSEKMAEGINWKLVTFKESPMRHVFYFNGKEVDSVKNSIMPWWKAYRHFCEKYQV